jgi:hypothetical protein
VCGKEKMYFIKADIIDDACRNTWYIVNVLRIIKTDTRPATGMWLPIGEDRLNGWE